MTRRLEPMLATWVSRPPVGAYHYEIKLDGYRLLAHVDGRTVSLRTRNAIDYTAKLPELADALRALRVRDTWLDGEIVVFDAQGVSHFSGLQDALARGRSQDIRFVVFDLLMQRGVDVRAMPIEVRRERLSAVLAKALPRHRAIVPCTWVDGDPAALLDAARAAGYEGLIGKRATSRYVAGRSREWVKLTFEHRQEGIVVGYSAPQGAREGFGALLLAVHDDGMLTSIGRVGTGFSARTLVALAKTLRGLRTNASPLRVRPADARDIQWVRPTLVVDVEHAGFTAAGQLRKAVFVGLRPDRDATDVVRHTPEGAMTTTATKRVGTTRARTVRQKAQATDGATAGAIAGVAISHGDRVIDTVRGATKRDLAQFYADIAPHILPHLARRPVALLRAPEGVGHATFFQKHGGPREIPGVRQMAKALDPEHAPLLAIDDVHALVGAVQMGTIELHTWNATETSIEKPDRLIFDLDPDPSLPFAQVRRAAIAVHALLDELGLVAFVKTTGGKGLHLVVPLTRHAGWDAVKAFTRQVAVHVARTLPAVFVAKSGAANRSGRIFVDYLRNGRGSSTAAAYSVRARPGLTVSVPISWDALGALRDPASLHIGTVPKWLTKHGDDAWADYSTTRQRITQAMVAQLGG